MNDATLFQGLFLQMGGKGYKPPPPPRATQKPVTSCEECDQVCATYESGCTGVERNDNAHCGAPFGKPCRCTYIGPGNQVDKTCPRRN